MAEKVWKKFEKDLKKLVNNIDNTVLKKLKSNFMETPVDYLISNECSLIIIDTIEKISYNKQKAYIHLLDFKKSLKSVTTSKRRCPIEPSNEVKKRKLADDECDIGNLIVTVKDEEKDFLEYYNTCTTAIQPVEEKVDEKQVKIDKYISTLENVLQATKVQIERLEEDELSLDDLDQENNSFIMLDKLKSHCVKVWRKICKLRNSKSKLHTRQLKTFAFNGTIYPELNTIIEDFVKMKKFPDFHDIKVVVSTYAKEKSMNMSSQKISELSLDIFTQIGNKLKKLRIGEFVTYFGNHLTDQVKSNDNPILKDDNLKRTLIKNHSLGQIKMDEVLDKYSKLEQRNGMKDDDSVSDISTEHSVVSDNEDIEENLEDVNLETFNPESDIGLNDVSSSNDDNDQDCPEPIAPEQDIVVSVAAPEKNDRLSVIVPAPPPPTTAQMETNEPKDDGQVTECAAVVEVNEQEFVTVLVTDEMLQAKRDTEQEIKEIECHTFQFNIDQIRQGAQGTVYPATITIDSSDDDHSESSDDFLEAEDNSFAYSSKLDDFIISRPKTPKIVDTGIFISLDDSDDDKNL